MELEFVNGTGTDLPVSAQDTVEFTPEHYRQPRDKDAPETADPPPFRDDAPVYYLRVPIGRTKTKLEAAIARAQAVYPSQRKILRTIREGVKSVVAPHQQNEVLELLDQWEDARGDNNLETDDRIDLAEKVRDVEVQLADVYQPLQKLWEDKAYAHSQIIRETVRHHVASWEGLETEPAYKGGVLKPASVDAIPDGDQLAIHARVQELSTVSREQAKNSGSRPWRPSGRGSSKAPTKTRKTPGKSTAKSTSGTPS